MRNRPRALVLAGVLLLAAVAAGAPVTVAGPATDAGPGRDTGPSPAAAERCVVVERAATGEPLLARPAENGTTVALAYTHSVEKTRVLDGYAVRGDRLVMTRMEFESYGAGLPARAAVNRTQNGSFVFDPPGAYAELFVQPGRVAGHVLHVGDRSWDLVALSNASGVRLHVAPDCPAGVVDGDESPGDGEDGSADSEGRR